MKIINPLLHLGAAMSASLLLFSCKKQMVETVPNESIVSMQANNASNCKPASLGVYSLNPTNPASGEWNTLAQKWYSNGKVKYLKARSGRMLGTFFDPYLELMFDLNWGEVSYQGNQVYLTDVQNNRTLMRVTLDNLSRPVASYLYNQFPAGITYWNDTSYYYYNGDRLDYVISMFETNGFTGAPFFGYRKFSLSYDSYGNLIQAQTNGSFVTTLQYDYSKPVTGMISNFQLTSSLKLLEYLELIQLPMHYALTRTDVQPAGFPSVYKNYVITDGLVSSYEYDDPFKNFTFYNGWDCGSNSASNATNKPGDAISSLKKFQQAFQH